MKSVRIGTRGSKLALWQAEMVAEQLKAGGLKPELVIIETKGDKVLDVSISKIGSKGVFTEEIEAQLEEGLIDIAVHSAKDMPSNLPSGFELVSFSERELVDDVLISRMDGATLNHQKGLRLGTSSTRRVAQLKRYYPQHEIVNVRGNLQTRLQRMDEGKCDALLLAYAGVHRMGYGNLIKEHLPSEHFIPPAGQGSVTIEVHKSLDRELAIKIRRLCNHEETENRILAERAFLNLLGGGCSVPVFVLAQFQGEELHVHGGVVDLDGSQLIESRKYGKASDAISIGKLAAQEVVAKGGKDLLMKIKNEL